LNASTNITGTKKKENVQKHWLITVMYQAHCLLVQNVKTVITLNLEALIVNQSHLIKHPPVDGVLSLSQQKKAQDLFSQKTMNTDVLTAMLASDTMRKV